MNTLTKKVLKNERGVTLIELLAVIVILGIIAAIAVPAVMSNFSDAKKNADAQTEAIVKEAVQRFLLNGGTTTVSGTDNVVRINEDLVTGGYLQSIPNWSSNLPIVDVIVTVDTNGKITFGGFTPAKPN